MPAKVLRQSPASHQAHGAYGKMRARSVAAGCRVLCNGATVTGNFGIVNPAGFRVLKPQGYTGL